MNKANFILANPNPQEIEIELWNSFRLGDREALNAIFEKYVRLLYAYGKNMTRDHELVSDCIQDIFIELWIKREALTAQVNSIKHYLIKSVRRRILRRLSADRRFVGRSFREDCTEKTELHIEFNLIQEQISREVSLQLRASVATLSKSQQEAIYLKFNENMTLKKLRLS
ncbi:MAG: sigma-70 family RNA polymerase sigma factor [Cyclobacteriaceae bacterium]